MRATVFSLQGFTHAFRNEAAFRQELAMVVLMAPIALWLGRDIVEKALLIGVLLFVLIVELLNSAVEAAIDRHGDEYHKLSGAAKDLGSAAVFTSLVLLGLVWGAVVWDRFFA